MVQLFVNNFEVVQKGCKGDKFRCSLYLFIITVQLDNFFSIERLRKYKLYRDKKNRKYIDIYRTAEKVAKLLSNRV